METLLELLVMVELIQVEAVEVWVSPLVQAVLVALVL
jgi:hypothetical protein